MIFILKTAVQEESKFFILCLKKSEFFSLKRNTNRKLLLYKYTYPKMLPNLNFTS